MEQLSALAMPPLVRMLIGAGLGAIIGSYLATIAIRMPQGQSANQGRSACDQCHRPLGPRDLVPVASYVLQRGRCRHCGAPIDPAHVVVELAAALIGALIAWAAPSLAGAAAAVFCLLLLLLAALDWRALWLPSVLVLLLAVTGLAGGGLVFGVPLKHRLIGGAAGFTALFSIAWAYRRMRGREGMGGGDPKLLGAIGLWTGWTALPLILLGASLIGLGYALIARWKQRESITALTALPFGSFMAVAAIIYAMLALSGHAAQDAFTLRASLFP